MIGRLSAHYDKVELDFPAPIYRIDSMAGDNLPSGTATFLFTDIEGSTRRWEEHREAMQAAVARHSADLRPAATPSGVAPQIPSRMFGCSRSCCSAVAKVQQALGQQTGFFDTASGILALCRCIFQDSTRCSLHCRR